ncbi:nuclear pore complex subunit Nro1-domain-containing protein [Mycotypha africana]|uniref:nuclear pore complex subunit Nro1-domain-containing protein n=1 Tax=Mycotypha africana TaxID=64632 RepID=UPI00230038A4|nr:nuclear pore complex subunit Nro1-domain-containing protein [Mycotypha africana]KAI8967921.1 nuclear pore complex subunit Nro1-domain-containing protein [Mycotypha africana]
MSIEKKRPRGLKGSAASKANKKAKTEEVSNKLENAQTVVIDKEIEEGDEVGETAALFENAIEKLDSDPSSALALLRGTIHESDRILRNHDDQKDEKPLPAIFYYTYGSALYELGRLAEEEDFGPYLDAAEERLSEGLELKDSEEVIQKIYLSLAKVWLAKAASTVSQGQQEIPEMSVKALEALDKHLVVDAKNVKAVVELADIVQNHGDLYENPESRDKFRLWAENVLEKVLKDEPNNAQALSALGLCKLSLANFILDNMDNSNEDDEKTERTEEEEKAYKAILESKDYLEKAKATLIEEDKLSPQILSDLAETYLNEANLTLKEEEQAEIYTKAADAIKEAKKLIEEKSLDFTLPEALTSYLEEFEA